MGGAGSGVGNGGNHRRGLAAKAEALSKWPAAPAHLTGLEIAAWDRLGVYCLAARTITKSDLLAVEITARILARVDGLLASDEIKITSLTGFLALLDKQLRGLGLCPAARRGVAALPKEADPDDPLGEF